MGSPETEEHRRRDETLHKVTISKSFYMAETAVTVEQYKAIRRGETGQAHIPDAHQPG